MASARAWSSRLFITAFVGIRLLLSNDMIPQRPSSHPNHNRQVKRQACDTKRHATSGHTERRIEVDVEGVVPGQCPTARPHPGVRRGQPRGAKPGGEAQGPPSRPGVTGEGKTDRVNISELPYASSFKAPTDGMRQRGAGLAAAKRQAPTGGLVPVGRTPPSRGKGSTRPGRTWSVSNVTTPLRSPRSSPARGKPTARKAQFRQRAQDDPEANAGTPKGNRKPGHHHWPLRQRPA